MKRRGLNEKGVSVIEVLIALSFAGVLIAAIGNALTGVHKLDTASAMREQATSLAREPLEIALAGQTALFVCSTGTGGTVSGTHCTAPDAQQCDFLEAYSSCWTPLARGPISCASATPCHFDATGDLVADEEWLKNDGSVTTIPDEKRYTRSLTIETLSRDNTTGVIVPTGTPSSTPDNNTKRFTVTVTWQENGVTKDVTLQSVLTGWKNIP